jgi:hypothetical protein
MNLPSGLMATSPQGGSAYQQQLLTQQGMTGAGALLPTAASQGMAGAMDQARLLQQQMDSTEHGTATAALNYGGPADVDGRNALTAAQRLVGQYKEALMAVGAIQPRGSAGADGARGYALAELGGRIGRG